MKKYINDIGDEYYNLDNMISVKELFWTFQEWDNIVKQYSTVTIYFNKIYANQFTFNSFYKYHVFYKKFVMLYLP